MPAISDVSFFWDSNSAVMRANVSFKLTTSRLCCSTSEVRRALSFSASNRWILSSVASEYLYSCFTWAARSSIVACAVSFNRASSANFAKRRIAMENFFGGANNIQGVPKLKKVYDDWMAESEQERAERQATTHPEEFWPVEFWDSGESSQGCPVQ